VSWNIGDNARNIVRVAKLAPICHSRIAKQGARKGVGGWVCDVLRVKYVSVVSCVGLAKNDA